MKHLQQLYPVLFCSVVHILQLHAAAARRERSNTSQRERGECYRKAASGAHDAVVGAAVQTSRHLLLVVEDAHHLRHGRRFVEATEHDGVSILGLFYCSILGSLQRGKKSCWVLILTVPAVNEEITPIS